MFFQGGRERGNWQKVGLPSICSGTEGASLDLPITAKNLKSKNAMRFE